MKTSIRHSTATCRQDARLGVLAAFRRRGTSVHAWAKSHDFKLTSVYVVIERWIDHPARRGRMPLGGVSRDIALALQAELGSEVVPLPEYSRAA